MSKLLLISHRGNISGSNPLRENQPEYISETLLQGYNVEIDVWLLNDIFYLGHDKPEYIINYEYLINNGDRLWLHCKNLAALDELALEPSVNCFAHNEDDYVLTSKNYVWVYPRNIKLTANCIACMPERVKGWDISKAAGICSDFLLSYEKLMRPELF